MTMRATWEQVIGRAGVAEAPAPPRRHRSGWSLLAAFGEEALTFTMTFVALLAAITSIQRADWVAEMPDLGNLAAASLVVGWLLARTPLPGWVLHPVGLLGGAAYVVYDVIASLRLDPGVEDTWLRRAQDLWVRDRDWYLALRNGDFSTDPIPFVLMVVFATWALAYIAAWAVAKWRNPWLALVPGAIALLTNISYLPGQPSAELIVFLFASILLFARLHMLRTIERLAADHAEPPPLLSLEVLNLATWLGILLIITAWIVPTANHWGPFADLWSRALEPITRRVDRFGELFVGISSKRATGLHQFENVLPLQGSISLGSDPLLSVDAIAEGYLMGAVYDQYSSNGWKLGPTTERPFNGPSVAAANAGTAQTRAQLRQPSQATVRINEPFNRRRVFSLGDPMASSVPARAILGSAPDDLVGLAAVNDLQRGAEYQTVGAVSGVTADRLITASPDYPAWARDRYLQLPSDLPGEVRVLARQIAGDEKVPYKLALRVEDYLRRNYAYTLDMGKRPPREDAVRYFLIDRRQGYSDYFASAMAVMLRSLGVPSRVAVGFALSEADRDPVTKQFVVTDQQSWVWPQVFFPGYGWVDFNPTPSRMAIVRPGDDTELPQGASDLPESDLFLEDPNLDLDIPASPSAPLVSPESAFSRFMSRVGTALLVAAAIALAVAGTGRVAWDLPFRSMTPATRRWAKLQLLAAWAGVRMRTDRTPLEEAAQLGSAVRRPPVDLRPLARAYVVERYGRGAAAESPESAARLDAIYLEARTRLMKRAISRFFSLRG